MPEPTASSLVSIRPRSSKVGSTSREVVQSAGSKELFFAVVGHVGSGTTEVAKELKNILSSQEVGPAFDVEILKAREDLVAWDDAHEKVLANTGDSLSLSYVQKLQDIGDKMRSENGDHAAVARALVRRIRKTRAQKTGQDLSQDAPIRPDGTYRAYILDSIRHPAEVELLARIYQDAFVLVGVVCDEEERQQRIMAKFSDAGKGRAREFMERDAKDKPKHGQKVSDAFHLAHFFLDNTEVRKRGERSNPDWDLAEQLSRLKKILTQCEVVRPYVSETAMLAAQGAQLRSACLSRQVGASVVDAKGNVIALGTNEVPRAGGGVYGATDAPDEFDDRCVYSKKYCSNNKEQERIVQEVLQTLRRFKIVEDGVSEIRFVEALKGSPIGALLEFSRAVHAEMDAILSLARRGISAEGTRVFVTTFPCHYCARHLVGAGVDEVQYIEPYPKSRALELHEDAIVTRAANWTRPSEGGKKVLFRPFVGVAPRMYSRVFVKGRDLKDSRGNYEMSQPDWTEPVHLGQLSYIELEARLAELQA